MANQRTVLVAEISYLGADGESHIAYRGDKINVADEGVQHFDWVHEGTPEAVHAREAKAAADAERAVKAAAKKPAADAVEGKKV